MASKLRMSLVADPDAEFARVTAKLRAAGRGDLQRNMVSRLRRRGKPAVRAVQGAIRGAKLPALPSRGGGASSGLRGRAAAAIGMSVTPNGVSIVVDGKKVDPAYGTSLVLALNGLSKLRHPVFGNRSVWVRQQASTYGLFYKALEPFSEQWRKDVEQVIADYAREIGG